MIKKFCCGALTLALLCSIACNLDKIEPDNPYASFEIANPGDNWIGCLVQFENKSFRMKTYAWDFGDGSTSTEANPVHTYNNSGTFSVQLIASSDTALTNTDTFSMDVVVFYVERGKSDSYPGSVIGALQTSDGGYLSYGFYDAGADNIIYAVKSQKNGAFSWALPLNSGKGFVEDIIETADKDFILIGYNNGTSKNLIWKFNKDGEEIWKKSSSQPSNILQEIELLKNGNIAIIGNRTGGGSELIIMNKDGEVLEEKLLLTYEGVYSFTVTPSGNMVFSGGGGTGFFFLLVQDANGNTIVDKAIPAGNGGYSNYVSKVVATSDGGYAIVGAEDQSCCENNKIMLLKTDKDGNVLFKKRYGKDSYIFGFDVLETEDGGFLITGNDQQNPPAQTTYDGYLAKTDRNGEVIWENWFTSEIGKALLSTDDCSYLMFAQSNHYGGGQTSLRKIDLNGN